MKKVLLATTVLAMSATVAAAEVKLSGDARMGIIRDFVSNRSAAQIAANQKQKITFTNRARVTFALSGTNDNGLTFGAEFRADQASNAASGLDGKVYIAGTFGKITMGKVDGAAAEAVGNVDEVGLTGLGYLNENTFIAKADHSTSLIAGNGTTQSTVVTGNPAVIYEYSIAGATVYASATKPGYLFTPVTALNSVVPTATYRSIAYGLGASYSLNGYKVVGGFETVNSKPVTGTNTNSLKLTQYSVGGDASVAGVTVKARYAGGKTELPGGTTASKLHRVSVSGSVAVLDFDVTGFYVYDKNTVSTGTRIQNVVGVGASYDLGGGAVAKGGFVYNRTKLPGTTVKTNEKAADLGVSFSF